MGFRRARRRPSYRNIALVLEHTKRVAIYLFSVHYPASYKAILSARNFYRPQGRGS
jgi:hypothetical protein